MKTHTILPIKGPQRTDRGAEPVSCCGTTINFSDFNWAIRPPGQNARSQARKARVSFIPEIKIGVLLGRCPAGRQALATWALRVVPTGMPL